MQRRALRLSLFPALATLLVGFTAERRFETLPNPFLKSGVVEGFFGPLYSFAERRALLLFTARAGLNTYIYAPKGDDFHRARWREPYPADYLAHFQELAALGADVGVRIVYAIAPALDFDPDAGDLPILVQKLESIRTLGIRDFCVFFDDVFGANAGADPEVQADIVIGAFTALRAADPSASLCFISQFYEGTAEQLATDSSRLGSFYPGHTSSQAYEAYERIPPEVPIMWTGPAVFTDRLRVSDAAAFRAFVGRPVLVWDNYPVNDAVVSNELFLGAYTGREPGLEAALDGILVNPMLQPAATEIPLWTVGRALALGSAYDPAKASAEALRLAVNRNRRALRPLRILASHFAGHPVIGDQPESGELAAAIDAFLAHRSARSRRALARLFHSYARNRERLARELQRPHANPTLFAELEEPSRKLTLLGEAGVLALKLLKDDARGKPVDTTVLRAKLAEAKEIRWLVGASQMSPGIAALIAQKPPTNVDVFGRFFDRVLADLDG
jgi:hyaluronoglucosaminidase